MTEDTRSVILRQAEFLIRTRGYAAFSYADLAQSAGITKASVHYHFPTKEDLVTVLVQHYLARFIAKLDAIRQRHGEPGRRLRDYALLFLDGFDQGMLPLCGALSAERSALPASMHATIHEFFRLHLEWLTGVLEEGLDMGALRAGIAPDRAALLLLSALEGGTFVGWALQRKDTVLTAFEAAMRDLELLPSAPGMVASWRNRASDKPPGGMVPTGDDSIRDRGK
ncbi:MAG: TetR/AcrR family transcriptional regulator [Geminicoccaceae bacterium]